MMWPEILCVIAVVGFALWLNFITRLERSCQTCKFYRPANIEPFGYKGIRITKPPFCERYKCPLYDFTRCDYFYETDE